MVSSVPDPSWTKTTSSPSPFRKKPSIGSSGRESEISPAPFHMRSLGPVTASPPDPARGREVVEDRLVAGEALEAHDLLGEERAVVAKLDVPLTREVA